MSSQKSAKTLFRQIAREHSRKYSSNVARWQNRLVLDLAKTHKETSTWENYLSTLKSQRNWNEVLHFRDSLWYFDASQEYEQFLAETLPKEVKEQINQELKEVVKKIKEDPHPKKEGVNEMLAALEKGMDGIKTINEAFGKKLQDDSLVLLPLLPVELKIKKQSIGAEEMNGYRRLALSKLRKGNPYFEYFSKKKQESHSAETVSPTGVVTPVLQKYFSDISNEERDKVLQQAEKIVENVNKQRSLNNCLDHILEATRKPLSSPPDASKASPEAAKRLKQMFEDGPFTEKEVTNIFHSPRDHRLELLRTFQPLPSQQQLDEYVKDLNEEIREIFPKLSKDKQAELIAEKNQKPHLRNLTDEQLHHGLTRIRNSLGNETVQKILKLPQAERRKALLEAINQHNQKQDELYYQRSDQLWSFFELMDSRDIFEHKWRWNILEYLSHEKKK